MTISEILQGLMTSEEEVSAALKSYEENGYVITKDENTYNSVKDALEENDFYVYDTQFINGEYRIYVEL